MASEFEKFNQILDYGFYKNAKPAVDRLVGVITNHNKFTPGKLWQADDELLATFLKPQCIELVHEQNNLPVGEKIEVATRMRHFLTRQLIFLAENASIYENAQTEPQILDTRRGMTIWDPARLFLPISDGFSVERGIEPKTRFRKTSGEFNKRPYIVLIAGGGRFNITDIQIVPADFSLEYEGIKFRPTFNIVTEEYHPDGLVERYNIYRTEQRGIQGVILDIKEPAEMRKMVYLTHPPSDNYYNPGQRS